MHIIIDAQPDPGRYAEAFRYVLRGAYLRVRVLGGIIVLIGILMTALASDIRALGVIFVVLGLLYVFYVPWRSVRTSIRVMPAVLLAPQRIELTDQGVSVASPLMSAQYAWGAFVATVEHGGLLLLLLSRRQVTPVPLTGVPPQQVAELRAVLANRAFVRQ